MKNTSTYVAVLLAVADAPNDLDSAFELITPLVHVVNKPLILHPLEFLCTNHFEEVVIVTSGAWERELRELVKERVGGKLRVVYVSVPDHTSSVECLRRICEQEALIGDKDLLLLPYSLVCHAPFCHLDTLHRTADSTVTILLSHKPPLHDTPLPKKYKKQEREVVVFSGGELVHLATETSVDAKLTLKPSLLKNACNFEVHSDLTDCHLYLISNRCIPCLKQSAFTSVQKDLVPWLVNNSFDESVCESVAGCRRFKSCIKDLQHDRRLSREVRRLVVKAYVHREGVCMRVCDVASFCAANFELSKQASAQETRVPVRGLMVCGQSSVGEGVEVAGKVVVKASVLGAHCSIGSNCRINNSIIMSHAIIQQNSNLDNCIVCESARVAEGSCLKECLVATGQAVSTGNYSNKEILANVNDRLVTV